MGLYWVSILGLITGDSRSFDCSSYLGSIGFIDSRVCFERGFRRDSSESSEKDHHCPLSRYLWVRNS